MTHYWILGGIIIVWIGASFFLSKLGETKEIGRRRLFVLSMALTPLIGLALYLSSPHRKMYVYKELFYKCNTCGYTFSEEHEHCPFCEKDGIVSKLVPQNKIMT